MSYLFTPGCALLMYKPELAKQVEKYLLQKGYLLELGLTCCRHDQQRKDETQAIVVCPSCARRFQRDHQGISPLFLWQIMAEDQNLSLPDYGGHSMSVHDACPIKKQAPLTEAVRQLLRRMNINIVEAEHNREHAICCGDSFQGKLPEAEVLKKMRERAAAMPTKDVVVSCIACIKSMVNGGKQPRYLLDLIFGEETQPGTVSPNQWHEELRAFIAEH